MSAAPPAGAQTVGRRMGAAPVVGGSPTPPVLAAMLDPGFYPGRPDPVELRETHLSWVLLAGERAYKLKKPVQLPFVDQRTLERRRELCAEEVRLNRRLAPRVYLGVRAIVPAERGYALAAADDPDAVEYAVEMRRYDEEATLDRRLAVDGVDAAEIHHVARRLAAFHAGAPRVSAWAGAVPAVQRALDENFHTLEAVAGGRLDRARLAAAERFAKAFLRAHAPRLHERARHGHMRDGHGDLRAEHIVLEDGVEIVDCLEFDPALRQIDVAADLAFLVMELVARHRPELAEHLAWAYRDAGGDPGDDALIAFFAAYRALVRAKVAAIRADQLFASNPERGELLGEAARLVELAGDFAWRARLPCVLVVCGAPAAGKSHLAGALGELSGLPVLGSDVTRKGLIDLSPTERAPAAAYVGDMNDRTYRELGRRARVEHAAHGGAIVDATFRRADDRAAFFAELAGSEAQIVVVECVAPATVRSARARARERAANRVSDATAEIAAREASVWEPLDDVSPDRHVVLRTDRELSPIVADLEAILDHYLASGRLDPEDAGGPTSSR